MADTPYQQNLILKPFPQCIQCLQGLADTAADMAAAGDPELAATARRAATEAMQRAEASDLTSPEVANRMVAAVSQATGVGDPYQKFKQTEMAIARQAAPRAAELLGSDLAGRAALAALGNSLDFFKSPAEALAEVTERAAAGVHFFHDDIGRLQEALAARPGLLLYLTDNSGEVYFDLPLYDYLHERAGRVVLMVKGGPSLNDLTRAELEAAGLAQHFDEVADTGTPGAGVEWGKVSGRFQELLAQADLVVSKGMANFETMGTRSLPTPVFFIFRVKCRPMRDFLDAPPDSFWALWREAGAEGDQD